MALNVDPVVEIKNLTKKYDNKVVVDNISLIIKDSCFALLGPNGAGKTTMFLMLLGLVRPTSGTAFILGNNILKNFGEIRRKIGFLPENVGFYPNLTGRKFLKLIISLRCNDERSDDDVESYLEWSGLEKNYWDKKVRAYSRGMRQRLGLAQAFIGEPKIVFLDEPLSNIDPLGREDFIQKIREKRKMGISIVISSHIVSEIEQLADYIAFIDDGKIIISDQLYKLAQSYGFNEYEITRIKHNEDTRIKELNEIFTSEKDLFSDVPKILSDKIIFQTAHPEKVEEIISNYEDFNFTPISKTLNKLYKHIIKRNRYEERKE